METGRQLHEIDHLPHDTASEIHLTRIACSPESTDLSPLTFATGGMDGSVTLWTVGVSQRHLSMSSLDEPMPEPREGRRTSRSHQPTIPRISASLERFTESLPQSDSPELYSGPSHVDTPILGVPSSHSQSSARSYDLPTLSVSSPAE